MLYGDEERLLAKDIVNYPSNDVLQYLLFFIGKGYFSDTDVVRKREQCFECENDHFFFKGSVGIFVTIEFGKKVECEHCGIQKYYVMNEQYLRHDPRGNPVVIKEFANMQQCPMCGLAINDLLTKAVKSDL